MKPRIPARTAEDFIETWQRAVSLAAVANTLGMTPKAAASRAWAYRKRGYALKRFPQGNKPLDDKRLRALAARLA